tara:strand:+ start:319 stop:606 length:288 start_codon:yes stop_codon:yes gene_type:complete
VSGFELQSMDIEDIERAQKQNILSDINYQANIVHNTDNPLKGVIKKQRTNARKAADVLNIGAGTRCGHCGLLHFMWKENCGSCRKPMNFNMGVRE